MALNSASAVLNKFRGWLGDTFAGDVLHINAVTCKWNTISEKGYRTFVCIVFTKVKLRKTLEKILGDEFTVAPVDQFLVTSVMLSKTVGKPRADGPHLYGSRPVRDGSRDRQAERNAVILTNPARDLALSGDISVLDLQRCLKRKADFFATDVVEPLLKLDNDWLYGGTGSGKSLGAREKAKADGFRYFVKDPNRWWDNYDGQEVVIIEDLDLHSADQCRSLKIWADLYPFHGEVKLGHTKLIRPQRIVVTSNYSPAEIWTRDGDLEPILRRFRVRETANFVIGRNVNDKFVACYPEKPAIAYQQEHLQLEASSDGIVEASDNGLSEDEEQGLNEIITSLTRSSKAQGASKQLLGHVDGGAKKGTGPPHKDELEEDETSGERS